MAQSMLANRSLRLLFALLGLSTTVVLAFGALGDYPRDAGPGVVAVANGQFLAGLGAKALMGSVSILMRAPFVALAQAGGLGELWQYRAGAVACLAPAAAVGVGLAGRLWARPQSDWVPAIVAILAVANPATAAAVRLGHPEEVLTAALAVGAVVLAVRERSAAAGVVLGLALATKQWALVAVVPAIVAAPRAQRLRLLGIAVAVAAALTLPVLLANPTGFVEVGQQAATTPLSITRTNVWFLLAHPHTVQLDLPAGFPSEFVLYRIPAWVGRVSHPLIVVAAVPFAAFFASPTDRSCRCARAARPRVSSQVRTRPGRQCLLPRTARSGAPGLGSTVPQAAVAARVGAHVRSAVDHVRPRRAGCASGADEPRLPLLDHAAVRLSGLGACAPPVSGRRTGGVSTAAALRIRVRSAGAGHVVRGSSGRPDPNGAIGAWGT